MADIPAYEQIHSELKERRSQANSRAMIDALDRALALTEESRACLDELERQRVVLFKEISNGPPLQPAILSAAAATVAAEEETEFHLWEELRRAMTPREPYSPRPVPEDASPEIRDVRRRAQELLKKSDELIYKEREPETIRLDIEKSQQRKQRLADTALTAIEAAGASHITVRVIFAVGNLWLTNVLVNQIYDTSDVSFEMTLRKEKVDNVLSWSFEMILGLLPLVGMGVGLRQLMKTLAGTRNTRWASADSTLTFLETYEQALREWIQQCQEHSQRAASFIAAGSV